MIDLTKLEERINREIDRRKYGLEYYILSQNLDRLTITKRRGNTTQGYDCADSAIKIALILLEEGMSDFTIWEGISEDGVWGRHFFIEIRGKTLDGVPPYPTINPAHKKIKRHAPNEIWEQITRYNFVPLTNIIPIIGEINVDYYLLLRAGLIEGTLYSDVLFYKGRELLAAVIRRYISSHFWQETFKIYSHNFPHEIIDEGRKMFERESIRKLERLI